MEFKIAYEVNDVGLIRVAPEVNQNAEHLDVVVDDTGGQERFLDGVGNRDQRLRRCERRRPSHQQTREQPPRFW